jgi:hypothetical protein
MSYTVEFFNSFSEIDEQSLFGANQIICFNQFSRFDNGNNIIFCKMDWLHNLFELVSPIDRQFTIIAGNSDFCIGNAYHPLGDSLADLVPENVLSIYCQNNLVHSDHQFFNRFISLPVGIENFVECRRKDHGPLINNGVIKAQMLSALQVVSSFVEPHSLIYANFSIRKGCQSESHRLQAREICRSRRHITWHDATLSLPDFFLNVLRHKATVCAQGNGPGDNHRIYEVLYLGRIPITFNRLLYDRIHRHFPVICLDDPEELSDLVSLERKIDSAQRLPFDKSLLNYSSWLNI